MWNGIDSVKNPVGYCCGAAGKMSTFLYFLVDKSESWRIIELEIE